MIEKTIEKKRIYTGNLINLNVDRIILSDKRKTFREYVNHPGASAIIPFINDDEIVLVRQFRYSLRCNMLEIPAGIIEDGENPIDSAKRELVEEIGYKAGNIEEIGWFYPSPGYTDERIYIYRASNLKKAGNKIEKGIEIEKISYKKALTMVKSGEISDGKTIIALLSCID